MIGSSTSDQYSLTPKALTNFATEMMRKLERKVGKG